MWYDYWARVALFTNPLPLKFVTSIASFTRRKIIESRWTIFKRNLIISQNRVSWIQNLFQEPMCWTIRKMTKNNPFPFLSFNRWSTSSHTNIFTSFTASSGNWTPTTTWWSVKMICPDILMEVQRIYFLPKISILNLALFFIFFFNIKVLFFSN